MKAIKNVDKYVIERYPVLDVNLDAPLRKVYGNL